MRSGYWRRRRETPPLQIVFDLPNNLPFSETLYPGTDLTITASGGPLLRVEREGNTIKIIALCVLTTISVEAAEGVARHLGRVVDKS